MPTDYSNILGLDINAKKLDKVRQPDEASEIKTAKSLDVVRNLEIRPRAKSESKQYIH